LKHDGQVAIACKEFQVALYYPMELFQGMIDFRQFGAPSGKGLIGHVIKDRNQYVVFVFEIEVDRSVSDSGFTSYVGNLGIEEAVPGEDLYRRTKYGFVLAVGFDPGLRGPLCCHHQPPK
jgi:hypothetical protein